MSSSTVQKLVYYWNLLLRLRISLLFAFFINYSILTTWTSLIIVENILLLNCPVSSILWLQRVSRFEKKFPECNNILFFLQNFSFISIVCIYLLLKFFFCPSFCFYVLPFIVNDVYIKSRSRRRRSRHAVRVGSV